MCCVYICSSGLFVKLLFLRFSVFWKESITWKVTVNTSNIMSSPFCLFLFYSWNFISPLTAGKTKCSEFLRAYCTSKHHSCLLCTHSIYVHTFELHTGHFTFSLKWKWNKLVSHSVNQLVACLLCELHFPVIRHLCIPFVGTRVLYSYEL